MLLRVSKWLVRSVGEYYLLARAAHPSALDVDVDDDDDDVDFETSKLARLGYNHLH